MKRPAPFFLSIICLTLVLHRLLAPGAAAQPAVKGLDPKVERRGPDEKPSPEAVGKLIAHLRSADFRVRREASDQLEKFGSAVLPALRKAAAGKVDVEVRRRIELVVSRIEEGLLNAEEKRWQDYDAPELAVKVRLLKIVPNTATLSDEQVTSAVYLLSLGRRPTEEELKRGRTQIAGIDGRPVNVLRLARSLVQSTEFKWQKAGATIDSYRQGEFQQYYFPIGKSTDEAPLPEFRFYASFERGLIRKLPEPDVPFALSIGHLDFRNARLHELAGLKNLRALVLGRIVNDAGLKHIAAIKNLQTLDLGQTTDRCAMKETFFGVK